MRRKKRDNQMDVGDYILWFAIAILFVIVASIKISQLDGIFGYYFCYYFSYLNRLMIVLYPITLILGLKWNRTSGQILINSFLPLGIYVFTIHVKNYPVLGKIVAIIAVVCILAYIIVLFGRRIKTQSKQKRRMIMLRRADKAFRCVRVVVSVATAVFFVGCLGAVKLKQARIVYSTVEATQAYDLEEEVVKEAMPSLLLLALNGWAELKNQEKLDVLQTVINLEQARFGLSHAVTISANEVEDDVNASYVDILQHIYLNVDVLEQGTSWEALKSVCHEMYHAYQCRVIDAYVEVSEESRQLYLFDGINEYMEELENYVDGDKDYAAYYMQRCETDAREYSVQRTMEYYEAITKWAEERLGYE